MTIKLMRKNISAEPGAIVIDVTKNTLTKVNGNNNENFANNLQLIIKQHDYINETNTSTTKNLEIPLSELVRLAYLKTNYYSKTELGNRFNVTVQKQTTPETGFMATYVVKQNNAQVGEKINIPKDFLVKSATLKTSTANGSPIAGINKGDKYIDFVINSQDNSSTDKHIYLNVKDLVDVYTADESTMTLSNTNKFSVKDGGITYDKLATALKNMINNKVDKVSGKGLSTNDYTTAEKNKVAQIDNMATKKYVDDKILAILDPNGTIRLEIADKADADHKHGNITKIGKMLNNITNGIVITNGDGYIDAVSTIKRNKISDFAHTHTTAESTEASAFGNINSPANATQHTVNERINTALGNKVDKVSGKGLSSNDFTNALKSKLDGIADGANKYVHPSYTPRSGQPTGDRAPAFGGTFIVSQITSDGTGHVTGLTNRTITIPKTEASTATNGLMTIAQVTKLNGIAENANRYVHPTYTPRTGRPTAPQTLSFGGTITLSQVLSDGTGHVTGLTDRVITMPSSTAVANGANGLMTGSDKNKLDGIAVGANKTVIANNLGTLTAGSALDATQGKVLNDKVNGKVTTRDAHYWVDFYNGRAKQTSTNRNGISLTIRDNVAIIVFNNPVFFLKGLVSIPSGAEGVWWPILRNNSGGNTVLIGGMTGTEWPQNYYSNCISKYTTPNRMRVTTSGSLQIFVDTKAIQEDSFSMGWGQLVIPWSPDKSVTGDFIRGWGH